MTPAQVTRQIKELLRIRYPGPEWAGFDELRSTTGYEFRQPLRYLDYFALNLYPSKNHRRVAYEIKASRADFMNELDHPDKRKFAWDIANECFFACPAGLVSKDEIPEGWGLIELTGGGLRRKKAAKQHEAKPMSMGFIAAIARRSVEGPPALPSLFWVYAGRELDEKQLVQAATENLDRHVRDECGKAIDEFRTSDAQIRQERLVGIIRAKLDWNFCYEPDKFEEWVDSLNNRPVALPHTIRGRLLRMRSDIDELLGPSKS